MNRSARNPDSTSRQSPPGAGAAALSRWPNWAVARALTLVFIILIVPTMTGCASADSAFHLKNWEQRWVDGCDALNEDRLNDARRLLGDAVPAARALGDDLRLGITLNRSANAYRKSDMNDDAERLYAESIQVLQQYTQRSSGSSDELANKELANSFNALGQIQLAKHNLKDAEQSFQSAIRHAEKVGGSDMSKTGDKLLVKDVADSLNSLAVIFEQTGRSSQAESTYLRAFRFDLARAYEADGKSGPHTKAFESARLAAVGISEQEESKLNEMIRRYTPLMEAGNTAWEQLEYPLAEKRYTRAFDIARAFDANGVQALESLSSVLKTMLKQRKLADAERICAAYFRLIQKTKASKPIDNVLGEMAKVYIRQNKLGQAERIIEHRVRVREEVRGPNNFHVAETLYDLGMNNVNQNKDAEATQAFKRAERIIRENGMQKNPLYQKVQEQLKISGTQP